MADFPGLLARDFGYRPQGKSAPMSAAKQPPPSSAFGSASARPAPADPLAFDDVFGGPHKYSSLNNPPPSFDSIFDDFKDPNPNPKSSSMSSLPVYDKPVYDDDIFDGVPGIKSTAKVEYEDVFESISKGRGGGGGGGGSAVEDAGGLDDLLGSLGGSSSSRGEPKRSEDLGGFEELILGFGGSCPPSQR